MLDRAKGVEGGYLRGVLAIMFNSQTWRQASVGDNEIRGSSRKGEDGRCLKFAANSSNPAEFTKLSSYGNRALRH